MVDVGVDQLGPGLPQRLDNEADEANLVITCHILFVFTRLFLKAPVTSPHWHCLGRTWRTPPVPQPSPERRQREISQNIVTGVMCSPGLPGPRTRPSACPPTPCTAPAAWSGC